MIKVNLITNAGRKTILVAETATPRQIFDENDVNYAAGRPALDSVPFAMGDMDKTFAELGAGETAYLTCLVKADNAANAVVMGNACVITSEIALEDLQTVAKYRPEALTLYEGEGKDKEPVFGVSLSKNSGGTINKFGATFSPTANGQGKATITMLVDPDETDVAGMLSDKIGPALLKLEKLEAAIPAVIEEVNAEKAAIAEKITVQ